MENTDPMHNDDKLLIGIVDPARPGTVQEVLSVGVPEGLSKEDLYFQILADVPAHEPQPIALNLDPMYTTSMVRIA